MLNTIKMDLYRMFKSKAFYITICIAAISILFSVLTIKYTSIHPETAETVDKTQEMIDDMDVGITLGGAMAIEDGAPIDDIIPFIFQSGTLLVMAAIFCVIFVCLDHSSGYIKNVVSRSGYRNQMSISKGVAVAIYSIIEFITAIVVFIVSFLICFGEIHINDIMNLVQYISLQLLIQIALLMLCVLASNITRNIGIAMAFAICLSANLFMLLAQLIDNFRLPIKISDYMLTVLGRNLTLNASSSQVLHCIIMSLIGIFIYQIASTLVIRRQDIK